MEQLIEGIIRISTHYVINMVGYTYIKHKKGLFKHQHYQFRCVHASMVYRYIQAIQEQVVDTHIKVQHGEWSLEDRKKAI